MTLIQKLAGCRSGKAYRTWRGEWLEFDFETAAGMLRWRVVTRWEWLTDALPRNIRWRIADKLCWLACKLRGHRTHEGWHGIQCNEAERLSQNIEYHLIPFRGDDGEPLPITLDPDDHESMRENLYRLEQLARATFWHE